MDLGRRPLVLLAMVAIAAAVEAAWLAPATLMDSRIARATRGTLRLAEAEGTLWRGRGVIAAANARIPIAWDIELPPLVRGEIRVHVRSSMGSDSPRGTFVLRANRITLEDADITIPASVIAAALGDGATGMIDGEVNGITNALDLAPGMNRGEARLAWRAARIAGVGFDSPLDLGEVRTTMIASGATMSGPLGNDGGSVALRGEWTLQERDGLSLALRVAPRRPDQVDLTRWLSAIGTPDGDGWHISWRVPLR
jgi:hypothetical protein